MKKEEPEFALSPLPLRLPLAPSPFPRAVLRRMLCCAAMCGVRCVVLPSAVFACNPPTGTTRGQKPRPFCSILFRLAVQRGRETHADALRCLPLRASVPWSLAAAMTMRGVGNWAPLIRGGATWLVPATRSLVAWHWPAGRDGEARDEMRQGGRGEARQGQAD
ncbi:hypothetical protein EDB80DRAFT_386670 [Ilyonectria destructans]|nr:hypothetical protein EDB80DRAFT_386670 [Ilyonectria destructans]